jgi:putative hydrolase
MLRELLEDVEVSVDARALSRLPSLTDLRELVDAVRREGLVALIARGRRKELIDAIQATMAVIEGYAEHVMDAVGEDVLPSVHQLRSALDRRRQARSTPLRLLERLLGLEMKLRQYEVGKRFCDAVVADGGIAALNRVWSEPNALPTLTELREPEAWRTRTQVRIVTN